MLKFIRKFLWNWRYLPLAVVVVLVGTPILGIIIVVKWVNEGIDSVFKEK